MDKYGIHIADRLGPEDAKGQSNWADIDDDEEWAPETITWGDGTKITLPQADEAVPSPSPVLSHATPVLPVVTKEPTPPVPPMSKSPAPTPSAMGSPSVKPSVPASGKSLVLKGVPERPTLVAKPPAPPTPAKSPWARLPPVEKVPPGQIDGPASALASRASAQDAVTTKSVTPLPTKEIAADDFSRSGFQEGQHPNNQNQLYNSQSGRYELVIDRRGSRNENHTRQPAVLQRHQHDQHHDQQGPAEPSAAFQTSRMSGPEGPYGGPYGRRRGSSNVSGTSGGLIHKLGKPHDIPPPPPETLQSRSASVITGGAESPVSTRTFSPAENQPTPRFQSGHPYQPRVSPGQAQVIPHHNLPMAETPNKEDDFEVQKKIMRERREQAIQRRKDQEAREEEARNARIAEKLKAMGPAPERKSARKEDKPLPSYARRTSIPASLATKPVVKPEALAEPSHSSPTNAAIAIGNTKSVADKHVNGGDVRAERSRSSASPATNVSNSQSTTPWPEASHAQHSERFTTWGGGSQNAPRNVWGAPGSDRSLGNGTFNPDLGSLPDSHPAPIADRSHRPAPIGPPRATSQQPPARPDALPSNRLAPIGPPRGRHSNVPQAPTATAGAWQAFATSVKDDDRRRALDMQHKIDAQVDKPSMAVNEIWRGETVIREGKRPEAGTDPKTSGNSDGVQSSSAKEEPTAPSGPIAEDPEVLELAKRSKGLMPTDFAARNPGPKTNGVRSEFGRQPPVNHTGPTAPGHPTQPRSSSRFFPPARGVPSQDHRAREDARTKSPTPPPPTADGHPVFDGDSTRPHVSLPPARPIVKLPPSNNPSPVVQSAKPVPVSFAAAAAAPPVRASSQPALPRPSSRGKGYGGIPQTPHEIMSQENWQDKINSLMGKKSTPPAKSLAVDSSSRIALEHPQSYDPAVALPGISQSVNSADYDDGDCTSKEMAEECFGEQEMGSLPVVRLPTEAPDALWQPAELHFDPLPAKLRINPTGASEAFRFPPPETSNGRIVIRISAPFMPEAKTVLMPYTNTRTNSNPRRQGPRGGPRRLSGRGGQRGGRDHSDHDHAMASSSSRPPSTRSGRGGAYRPRTENWGRHTSAASAAQS